MNVQMSWHLQNTDEATEEELMKFCFVILHFLDKAIEDTIECVESILNNVQNKDYNIVIVDNGSPDKSFKTLKEKFDNIGCIDVITTNRNLGFAKGNNYGSLYALDKYSPEILVVINNDTLIYQPDFLDLIWAEYEQFRFGVLGPFIYDRNHKPQNPMQKHPVSSVSDIEKKIRRMEDLIRMDESDSRLSDLFIKMKRMLKKSSLIRELTKGYTNNRLSIQNLHDPNKESNEVILHGAALIFSREYFENRNYVFYPETFLYVEEEILHYICARDQIVMRYQPKIEIYHKEDSSTNALYSSEREKSEFIHKELLKSYKIFRKLLIHDMEESKK